MFGYIRIKKSKTDTKTPITSETKMEEETLSPEEVIANLDKDPSQQMDGEEKLEVEIVSPEEESFIPSQARFYKAIVNNTYKESKASCHWKFYMTEVTGDEYLYKEMFGQAGKGDTNWCGFTSTFIDKVGVLRVELTVESKHFYNDEIYDTVTVEKEYKVIK